MKEQTNFMFHIDVGNSKFHCIHDLLTNCLQLNNVDILVLEDYYFARKKPQIYSKVLKSAIEIKISHFFILTSFEPDESPFDLIAQFILYLIQEAEYPIH